MYGYWTANTLVQNDYTMDNAGQRLSNAITSGGSTKTERYTYDELNRLNTVDYGDSETQSYAFDAMGNRSSKVDSASGTEGYSYNAANMLTARVGNSYTNDAAGNTLSGGGRTNTWDSQNRLVACAYGTNSSSYVYGADGIRRQSTVNSTTTDFVTDNSMSVRERAHTSGSSIATYLVGARGPGYRRDDAASTIRWYLYDGLGSVTGEVDPSGTVSSSREYDVYGVVRGGSSPGGTSKHKFVGSHGHPSDDETGLIYMRARCCDPQLGRFVSEDSQHYGTNWYAYCSNNPVDCVDASGHVDDSLYNTVKALFDMFENDGAEELFLESVKKFTIEEFRHWIDVTVETLERQGAAHLMTANDFEAMAQGFLKAGNEEAYSWATSVAGRQGL